MFEKRVTLFVGHFGSGKTEIALNGALDLAGRGVLVTVADLDVVKPYFRSRSARRLLSEAGIELLAPDGANIHADLPIIVPQIRHALRGGERRVVVDVGGDDTGARVVGSLSDVMSEGECDCIVVLNFRRPFTRNVAEAVAMVRAIEAVSRVGVTGLVSNTHLMTETTAEVVLEGYEQAVEASESLGVPLRAVTVQEELRDELRGARLECPLVLLRRIVKSPFEQTPRQRTTGPLFVVN